jgi:hypothetical protein
VGKYSAEPLCTKEIEAQLDAGGNATVTDCKHVPCDNTRLDAMRRRFSGANSLPECHDAYLNCHALNNLWSDVKSFYIAEHGRSDSAGCTRGNEGQEVSKRLRMVPIHM